MNKPWENSFDSVYRYVRGKMDAGNRYHKHFHINALLIYLLFGDRLSIDNKLTLKLLLKRGISYLFGKLSLLWVNFRSYRWDLVIVLSEPNHVNQFKAFARKLKGLRVLLVTDKIEYVWSLYSEFGLVAMVSDGVFPLRGNEILNDFLNELKGEQSIPTATCASVKEIILHSFSKVVHAERLFTQIMRNQKIRGVLTFNDHTPFGRTMALCSNNANVPSFYCMHGLLSDEYIESIHICSHYYVYGEATQNIFVKRGIPIDHVETIGSPYMDSMLKDVHNNVLALKSRLKISPGSKVVLISLSGPGHTTSLKHHHVILKAVREMVIQADKEINFIFKLHKKDQLHFYDEILKLKRKKLWVFSFDDIANRYSIIDWISVSDVVISGASTSVMQAMIVARPVVTVDLMGEYSEETIFIREGATYHVSEPGQLMSQLERALRNDDGEIAIHAKEFVKQAYFKLDGHAGERLGNSLVSKLI
ncbi:MAG: hypothetical protein SH819_10130 [Cytophagales bacterium]|mgnify:CR=1 FL=1|nr:hypothetical protein [Cytophagales bacterium]